MAGRKVGSRVPSETWSGRDGRRAEGASVVVVESGGTSDGADGSLPQPVSIGGQEEGVSDALGSIKAPADGVKAPLLTPLKDNATGLGKSKNVVCVITQQTTECRGRGRQGRRP